MVPAARLRPVRISGRRSRRDPAQRSSPRQDRREARSQAGAALHRLSGGILASPAGAAINGPAGLVAVAGAHAGFDPSGTRALAVSRRMRERLGDSLRYIVDSAAGQLRLPPGLPSFFGRLADGPVPPLVFGAYCDLVLPLQGDALAEAGTLLAEFAAPPTT